MAGEWTQVVTDHQEVTADLQRLSARLSSTPLRPSAPFLRSPDIWCESGGRQSRTTPHLSFHTETPPSERATTLAPSSDRAPGRPALRLGRSPQSAGAAARWREICAGVSLRSQHWGQYAAASLGWTTSGRFWGQFAASIQEPEEESRPFQRRSPGDASVNARAMSRRKQGNPQHLSQREITRKYTRRHAHHHHHRTGLASVLL